MKTHTLYKKVTLAFVATMFLTAILLPFNTVSAVTPDAPGSAPTGCQKDWHKKTFTVGKNKDDKEYAKFQKTDCRKSKGGPCKVTTVTDSREKVTVRSIDCTDNNTVPGGTNGNNGSGSIDTIEDPALTSGGCTATDCPFIDAYVSPGIKLLSALVGIMIVAFIIFGAIQVSSSAGDPQKMASGKDHIRNAIIAAIGYAMLFVFIQWLIPGGV